MSKRERLYDRLAWGLLTWGMVGAALLYVLG